MVTYINHKDKLHDQLVEIQNELQTRKWGDIHRIIVGPNLVDWTVTYHEDDDGAEYALVSEPNLPIDVYAEIEGETYGELTGWRIYK